MNDFILLALILVSVIGCLLVFFGFDEKLAKKEEKNALGKLIVIEGIEGSGKTVLMNLLKGNLPEDWAYTKEPYYINDDLQNWTKENYQLDRENHIQNKILPILQQKRILVTNRYWMSGCVYDNWEAESYLSIWPEPDLILWLDYEPKESDPESQRTEAELKELRQKYYNLFSEIKENHDHLNFCLIKTDDLAPEEILKLAMNEIKKVIPLQKEFSPQINSLPISN